MIIIQPETRVSQTPSKGKKEHKRIQLKVTGIMTKKIIFADETANLREAAQILIDEHISHLPIMKNKKIIGIISKTDVLKAASVTDSSELDENKLRLLAGIKISGVMKTPIYVYSNATLSKVSTLMEKFKINSVLVLDKQKGSMLGIITKSDLMKTISKSFIGNYIATTIDEVLKTLEQFGSLSIDKLAKTFGVKPELVEEWGKILEEHGMVTVVYPTFGKPYLKIVKG